VEQLADSRRSILVTLKQKGCATIAQLADALELTGEAVRQQLLQLQREGWIEPKVMRSPERGRTGRPATSYVLTAAGDHLFPKHYDALNVAMVDALVEELGEDALKKVLARVAQEKVAQTEPSLRGLPMDMRMQQLKDWYLDGDPYMDVEELPDGFRLIERNCPFINTAMQRPALCSISVNAMSRLLGARVVRVEKFQKGDGRCVFRVYKDQPVESAEFKLEKETDPD
jgi:predicted ArsR family transcriptional regulator